MLDQHALLSASGAHRWLSCPPSARAEAGLPDSSAEAAEQGTVAHALAEWKVRRLDHRLVDSAGDKPVSEWIDEEMERYTDEYVTFVLEQAAAAKMADPSFTLRVEQRLDFCHIVPGGFGTGDCVIIAEPTLQIIDLKYGQGVLVEAENNPQLMLYTLGALHTFGDLYDIERVAVTIYQPRRANVDTCEVSVAELQQWAETEVIPKAELASAGEGEFCPGSWCQFCRIAPTCRAWAEANLTLAKLEFAPPEELSDAEIADVLARIPDLKSWASDVEAYALSKEVNQGVVFEGVKIVAGRSVRKYISETDVAVAAEAAGYRDIWDRKLIPLTAMEKLMGKPAFNKILGDLVTKPAGKPTLIPASDKRPALDPVSAATNFQLNK